MPTPVPDIRPVTRAGLTFGAFILGTTKLWTKDLSGLGVTIGIIDDEIDNKHPALRFTADGRLKVIKKVFFLPVSKSSHSTPIAGLAAGWSRDKYRGIAYNAQIINYVVLTQAGTTTMSRVTRAIRQAIVDECDIINISIGGANPDLDQRNAIAEAHRRGIVIVCSSGNMDIQTRRYPSSYPETISVAAVIYNPEDGTLERGNSTSNDRVTCCAVGRDLVVCRPGGVYTLGNGTSFAAPQVTGFLALIMEKYIRELGSRPDPDVLLTILTGYCLDISPIGKDNNTGYGIPTLFDKIPKIKAVLIASDPVDEEPGSNPIILTTDEFDIGPTSYPVI